MCDSALFTLFHASLSVGGVQGVAISIIPQLRPEGLFGPFSSFKTLRDGRAPLSPTSPSNTPRTNPTHTYKPLKKVLLFSVYQE